MPCLFDSPRDAKRGVKYADSYICYSCLVDMVLVSGLEKGQNNDDQ